MKIKALNVKNSRVGKLIELLRSGRLEFTCKYIVERGRLNQSVFIIIEFEYPDNLTEWFYKELISAVEEFDIHI